MPLPVGATPMVDDSGAEIPGWTILQFDDNTSQGVYDPDGSFLSTGKTIMESQAGYGSPAQMRGSGALGPDTRLAQTADPTTGQIIPDVVIPPDDPTKTPWLQDPIRRARENSAAPPPPPPAPTPVAQPEGGETVPSGPTYVIKPGSAGGWRETGRQTTGIAPEEKGELKTLDQQVQDKAQTRADNARAFAEDKYNRDITKARSDYQQGEVQRIVAEDELQKRETRKNEAFDNLKKRQSTELNNDRTFGNVWFSLLTAIGGFSAELNSRRKRDPRLAQNYWGYINNLVNDDIARQKYDNSSTLKAAETEFGDADLAVKDTKARLLAATAQRMRGAAAEEEAEDTKFQLTDLADKLEGEALSVTRQNAERIADRQTLAEQNMAGTPDQVIVLPSVTAQERVAALQADGLGGLNEKQSYDAFEEQRGKFATDQSILSRIDMALAAIKEGQKSGDVAGYGPLAKYLPTNFASQDAQQARQTIGMALSAYIKEVSGASVTEQEFNRLQEQVTGDGSYDSIARGLSLISGPARSRLESQAGSYPNLYQVFHNSAKRGATSQRGGPPQPKGKR